MKSKNMQILKVTALYFIWNPKRRQSYPTWPHYDQALYGYLYIKTKIGMAGLIFQPHPPNFENQYNFCSNDPEMIFWFLYWFQIFKD